MAKPEKKIGRNKKPAGGDKKQAVPPSASVDKQAYTLYSGAAKLLTDKPARSRAAAKRQLEQALFPGERARSENAPGQQIAKSDSGPPGQKSAAAQKARGLTMRRVGIWDTDVYAGFLYRVLDTVNANQTLFEFHSIEASVPVGLTRSGERARRLAVEAGLRPKEGEIENNVLASDIYLAAAPLRENLGLDMLVVLISRMIMDLDDRPDDPMGMNFFSTSKDNVIIASAYDLEGYARSAERTFEASLASLVAAAVIAEVYPIVWHDPESVGCVFDYCNQRDDIVLGLRSMMVCEETMTQIPKSARGPVRRLFKAIEDYKA